jgi:hypothetical protein
MCEAVQKNGSVLLRPRNRIELERKSHAHIICQNRPVLAARDFANGATIQDFVKRAQTPLEIFHIGLVSLFQDDHSVRLKDVADSKAAVLNEVVPCQKRCGVPIHP